MGRPFVVTNFDSGKTCLWSADHWAALAVTLAKGSPLATDINGRKIVKCGTLYPLNDATATGVILQDVDVTDGDANAAVVYHGLVALNKLPVAPSVEAKTALPMIKFVGA